MACAERVVPPGLQLVQMLRLSSQLIFNLSAT